MMATPSIFLRMTNVYQSLWIFFGARRASTMLASNAADDKDWAPTVTVVRAYLGKGQEAHCAGRSLLRSREHARAFSLQTIYSCSCQSMWSHVRIAELSSDLNLH